MRIEKCKSPKLTLALFLYTIPARQLLYTMFTGEVYKTMSQESADLKSAPIHPNYHQDTYKS